jgi:hypothetical protein
MGVVTVVGVVGFVGFLAIVAAIPMSGNKTTLRLWVIGVGLAAAVLGIAFWPRPATGPGSLVVFNEWTEPVVVETRTILDTGPGFQLEPHQFGPFDPGWPSGTEVMIFTTDCRLVATSHIEGRNRGTVIKPDGSIDIEEFGADTGPPEYVELQRCPQPRDASTLGT